MGNNRFTIVNDNRDQILISKSLRDQMTKKQQQQKQQQTQDVPKDETKTKSAVNELFDKSAGSSFQTESKPADTTTSSYPSLYPELPPLPQTPPYNPFGSSSKQTSPPPSPPPQSSYPMPPSYGFDSNYLLLELRNEYERKFQHYQSQWRKNIEDLDRMNKELLKKNKEILNAEVKKVDDTLLKKHLDASKKESSKIRDQPCKETEEKLLRCFQVNEKKSLLCSDLVRQFTQCIDEARIAMLKQK